jgi:hypothetical protein
MKRPHLHHILLIFGAYGVWFAILSGLEEISTGKLWKAGASLALGAMVYVVIETSREK